MTIGEQIALQRRKNGITQEALAEVSGISLRTIQRIESGRSAPRAYTLKILAHQLGLDVEQLTTVEDHPAEIASVTRPISVVQQMNAAGLTILLFPFLPLLIVVVLWVRNNKDGAVRSIGKRIISFHIILLILIAFVLAATQIIYYYLTGSHIIGHISPLLPVYLLMLAFNAALVIFSACRLQKQALGIYRFIPPLF